MILICEYCGGEFTRKLPWQRFCQRSCQRRRRHELNPQKVREIYRRYYQKNLEVRRAKQREYYWKKLAPNRSKIAETA